MKSHHVFRRVEIGDAVLFNADCRQALLEIDRVAAIVTDPPYGTEGKSGYYAGTMTPEHVTAMRAYLRQWIAAPAWRGAGIERLRAGIDGLTDRGALAAWIDVALDLGIDPL